MNVEEAIKKVVEHFGNAHIEIMIQVNDGWVVSVEGASQPTFVNEKYIRGLNGNVEKDKDILRIAYEKMLNSDFY